jgi:hypothetical protein
MDTSCNLNDSFNQFSIATQNVQQLYSVVATNAAGCTATETKTIYIYPTPILNTVANPTALFVQAILLLLP